MTDQTQFSYSIVQYRHDTFAAELVNVGVLLYSPGDGFFDAKVRKSVGRLAGLYNDLNAGDFRSCMDAVRRGVKEIAARHSRSLFSREQNALDLGRLVIPQADGCLTLGKIGYGVTSDPASELEKLFSRFVSYHDSDYSHRRNDEAIWKPVRKVLAEKNLADRLTPKKISTKWNQVTFDHCWKNGVWHCYQPLSFDLASGEHIQNKANKWAGALYGLSTAKEDFKSYFLVGKPEDTHLIDDYRRAVDFLRSAPLSPEVIEDTKAAQLAHRLAQQLHEHETVT